MAVKASRQISSSFRFPVCQRPLLPFEEQRSLTFTSTTMAASGRSSARLLCAISSAELLHIKGGVCGARPVGGSAGAAERVNGFLPHRVRRKNLSVSAEQITRMHNGGGGVSCG